MLKGYVADCGFITNKDGILDAYMETRQRMFG